MLYAVRNYKVSAIKVYNNINIYLICYIYDVILSRLYRQPSYTPVRSSGGMVHGNGRTMFACHVTR
jgi:hypothetical protein